MKQNLGTWDRILRTIAGLGMIGGAFVAPLPMLVRVVVLGVMGAYLLVAASFGTCLGYRIMGMSTCPVHAKGETT